MGTDTIYITCFFLLRVLCAQLTLSVLQEALWKWSQAQCEMLWWDTNRCGEQRRSKDMVTERARLAVRRRPLQRLNNQRHLSEKFVKWPPRFRVQTTCCVHERVEKYLFPLFLWATRSRTGTKTTLTLNRGRSAGGRWWRHLLSTPKTKVTAKFSVYRFCTFKVSQLLYCS